MLHKTATVCLTLGEQCGCNYYNRPIKSMFLMGLTSGFLHKCCPGLSAAASRLEEPLTYQTLRGFLLHGEINDQIRPQFVSKTNSCSGLNLSVKVKLMHLLTDKTRKLSRAITEEDDGAIKTNPCATFDSSRESGLGYWETIASCFNVWRWETYRRMNSRLQRLLQFADW